MLRGDPVPSSVDYFLFLVPTASPTMEVPSPRSRCLLWKEGMGSGGSVQSAVLLERVHGQGWQSGPGAVALGRPRLCGLGQVISPSELQFVIALTSEDCFSAVSRGLALYSLTQNYLLSTYNECAADTVLGANITAVNKRSLFVDLRSSRRGRQPNIWSV